MANKSSVFVFSLMMCPFKSSSDKVVACFISNASDIAITENLSTWYSSQPFFDVKSANATGSSSVS